MTDGRPHPSVDELLDAYIAAWHAGEAPSLAASVARAAEPDRDELTELIGAFLQIAPTVDASTSRGLELVEDPLVHKLAALEGEWWDRKESLGAAPWGERLRALRERAGLSVAGLGERFAARFGLAADDAAAAPAALERLEDGALAAGGVAARAARALEELLGAPSGVLVAGAAPALGGALLRGDLPADADERERLAGLLRQVDDALPPAGASDAGAAGAETLRGLLGA